MTAGPRWGTIRRMSDAPGHFAAADAAFRAKDYLTAARQFLAAYAADPQPDLLYNVALSFRQARRPSDAAVHYRRYLRLSLPASPVRDRAFGALRDIAPAQIGELGDELFDVGQFAAAREAWAAWRATGAGRAARAVGQRRVSVASGALLAGRASEAAEAFAALYVATGDPEMAFRLAEARGAAGDRQGSRAAYAAYRRLAVSASRRAEATSRMGA